MIIAIASGKGGTGKTTVATSLALAISDLSPIVLDCDVEAPNAHIFLQPEIDKRREVSVPIPEVDENRCSGCGNCAEVCQYHAIVSIAGKVLVFPQLCHGCGSCTLNCPEEAITEVPRPLGMLEAGLAMAGIRFARGVLNIGEPMAVPVIRGLKHWQPFPDGDNVIIDAPPGTSCPVVESIRGTDFVLLITEPTPFGLHDLRLAVKLTRELGLPAGVVINRDGVGDTGVDDFCENHGLPILMRIPLERRIGEAIARGQALVEALPEYLPKFQQLYEQILLFHKRSVDSVQSPNMETQPSDGVKARLP
jgi:MinD superfamily P-loop ATPase